MGTEQTNMNGWARLQRLLAGNSAFSHHAHALAMQLRTANARTLAVYVHDAERMQLALSAAALSGCRILLPSSTASDTVAWCDGQCDYWYGDTLTAISKPYLQANATHLATTSNQYHANEPCDIDVVLMSSGSSGDAKVLSITLKALCEEAQACRVLFTTPHVEIRSSASLQHRYGLIFHALVPLLYDHPSVPSVFEMPETLLANQADNVWWVTSPTFLHHLAAQRDLPRWRGSVKGILSAGGTLSAALKTTIEQALQTTVYDVYGSSETGALAYRPNDVFHWLPCVQGDIGEHTTLVCAPWLSTATSLADRLQAQHDGGFKLLGRLDSVVKLADKRVDLAHVSALLLADEAISDVHIATHPSYPRLFAWVALNADGISKLRQQGRKALVARLRAVVGADQPRIAVPRYWRFETALPRNAQAKLTQAQVEVAMREPALAPTWACIERDDAQVRYRGYVPLDLLYLRGHFARVGVVPGVVELKWVRALAQQWLGQKLDITQIENLKFRQLLRPSDWLDIHIKWNAQGNKLLFSCENDAQVFATGRLVAHA